MSPEGNGAVQAGKYTGAAIGQGLKIAGPWGIAVLALVLAGATRFIPASRADAFTGTQGKEMKAELLGEMAKWTRRMSTHEQLPYHTGAGVTLAGIEAQLLALQGDVAEVKFDVREIRSKVGNGGD